MSQLLNLVTLPRQNPRVTASSRFTAELVRHGLRFMAQLATAAASSVVARYNSRSFIARSFLSTASRGVRFCLPDTRTATGFPYLGDRGDLAYGSLPHAPT